MSVTVVAQFDLKNAIFVACLLIASASQFVVIDTARADISIETFGPDDYNPGLAFAFNNPGVTITPGPTEWTIDLTTSTQSDYYGYAFSDLGDPPGAGFFDISSETALEFDFTLNKSGIYGTNVFIVLEDFDQNVSVYESPYYGLGNHVFKASLATPTFFGASGMPANLTDLNYLQIQANSFGLPSGGSVPYSLTFNDLKATSPIPPDPAVITDFNGVGVFGGYDNWASATITTGPDSLRVVSSGFGGAPGQAFGSLEAGGTTHAELDMTINSSDGPVNVVALLEDADGTQNVWRWYGLTTTNGVGGGNEHVLSFRMETIASEGAFDENPHLIDNATSFQTVYQDNTPSDLTDNDVLDLDNIKFFHVQIDPLGMAPNNHYDVSFNNLQVVNAPGSFDTDYDADGRDFLVWQRGLTPHPLSSADLAEWQANYSSPLSASVHVPEPTSGCLLVVTALAAAGIRRSTPHR